MLNNINVVRTNKSLFFYYKINIFKGVTCMYEFVYDVLFQLWGLHSILSQNCIINMQDNFLSVFFGMAVTLISFKSPNTNHCLFSLILRALSDFNAIFEVNNLSVLAMPLSLF